MFNLGQATKKNGLKYSPHVSVEFNLKRLRSRTKNSYHSEKPTDGSVNKSNLKDLFHTYENLRDNLALKRLKGLKLSTVEEKILNTLNQAFYEAFDKFDKKVTTDEKRELVNTRYLLKLLG